MIFDKLSFYEIEAFRSLGIEYHVIHRAEVRARRLEEKSRPDGAEKYVPITEGYAQRYLLGPRILRRLTRNKK